MNMPCKCEDTDEARILKKRGLPSATLRFIGGVNKTPSGPYAQYKTGKIYVVHEKFANQEIYPYWEPCEKEEIIETTEDDGKPLFISEDDVTTESPKIEVSIDSTDSTEDDVTTSVEVVEEEKSEEDEPSDGLTTLAFTVNQGGKLEAVSGFSEKEAISGMDTATLHAYIMANGGKADKRWGRKRLIQEALKL